jgi:predicted DNA binding CopG/RHH family protein
MGKLTQAERELRAAVERGEWRSVKDLEKQRARYQVYAQATLRKDRRINIRLSQKDLEALQTLAVEEGIPYQTLIASILHKYVSGRFVERNRLAMSRR